MTSSIIIKIKSCEPCLICNDKAKRIWSSYPGYVYPECFDIYRCPSCGTTFALPMVSRFPVYEWIYQNASQVEGYCNYLRLAKEIRHKKNPLRTLTKWSSVYWGVAEAIKHFSPSREVKILEVGSGLGYLTYALFKRGYNALGLDISSYAVNDAKRHFGDHYICAELGIYASNHRGEFDAVIMNELIEHVPNIYELLLAAKLCLRNRGKIIITTPNIDSLPTGALWISDAPPVHYWSFSSRSFIEIGSRIGCDVDFIDFHACGLDIPLEDSLSVDFTTPRTKPTFDMQGNLLLNDKTQNRLPELIKDSLADVGFLETAKDIKAGLRSMMNRHHFSHTPSTLCVQFTRR